MLQSKGMRMFNLTGKERATWQNSQNSLSLCFWDRKPPSLTLEMFIQKPQVLVFNGSGPSKITEARPAGVQRAGRTQKGCVSRCPRDIQGQVQVGIRVSDPKSSHTSGQQPLATTTSGKETLSLETFIAHAGSILSALQGGLSPFCSTQHF